MAKKLMAPKGTMTPPSRKNMLERVDKVIKKTVKPKNTLGAALARGAVSAILPKTNALKKALAQGDQSSASSSFTARAARKIATGAGKALKSMAAKPTAKIDSLLSGKKKVAPSVKIDSTKKVTPIGGSKPSVIIKKETKIKDVKPITKEFRKKMKAWDKLPKVEYKPLPKK